MNKIVLGLAICGGVLVLAILAALALGGIKFNVTPFAIVCNTNDEIAPATRTQLEDTTKRYVADFMQQRFDSLYDAFSPEAKKTVTVAGLRSLANTMLAEYRQLTRLTIVRVDLVEGAVGSSQRTFCGSLRPGETFSMQVAPLKRQAYVTAQARSVDKDLFFTVWLNGDDGWKIISIYTAIAPVIDKPPAELLALARQQDGAGRKFNAAVLYSTALVSARRGGSLVQNLQEKDIADGLAAIDIPELRGRVPLKWHLGNEDFVILRLGASERGGKLYLWVVQQVTWSAEAEVDADNAKLMAGIETRFAEYRTLFDGVVLVAQERDGRRWREVVRTFKK